MYQEFLAAAAQVPEALPRPSPGIRSERVGNGNGTSGGLLGLLALELSLLMVHGRSLENFGLEADLRCADV